MELEVKVAYQEHAHHVMEAWDKFGKAFEMAMTTKEEQYKGQVLDSLKEIQEHLEQAFKEDAVRVIILGDMIIPLDCDPRTCAYCAHHDECEHPDDCGCDDYYDKHNLEG